MAFPIPSHLPRRTAAAQDVSSAILDKIDSATHKTLTASLAASWLDELERNIHDTKKQIHDRIHHDLPLFEQQEASARALQTRLRSLTANVDDLVTKVSAPNTGLVPTLINALAKHAALQQQSMDADVLHECLDHLARFRTALTTLDSLVRQGKLSQAVAAYQTMDELLEAHPQPLAQSNILVDLKSNLRTIRARAEEQLSDAYTQSIVITPDTLRILPSVKVRQSDAVISLSEILAALSSSALTNHLSILRRDIISLYVVRLLESTRPLSCSASNEHQISCSPSHQSTDALGNVSDVLTFLSTHLFAALPPPQDVQFSLSIRKPLAQSVLNNLLIPSLPVAFDSLTSYLVLLNKAVAFEAQFINGILGGEHKERIIDNWANAVDGHYERQRRLLILDAARALIVTPSSKFDTFTFEVELREPQQPAVVPFQDEAVEDDAWGLDDSPVDETETVEPDGWGFDDEAMDTDPPPETKENGNGSADDPADAWGWNDDEEPMDDDPWGDPPPEKPIQVTSPPKAAMGLVKKDKKHLHSNGNGNGHVNSPTLSISSPPLNPSPLIASPAVPQKPPELKMEKRPPNLAPLKESYLVSSQTREILKMIENVLNEGTHLASSGVFRHSTSTGNLLMLTAPSILDMYRAIYPVTFGEDMRTRPDTPMRFSNNCLYLSSALDQVEAGSAKERLKEAQRRLRVLGDSWYHDTVERQRQAVDKVICDGAAGFTFTGDQDRYDECEAALSRVLQDVRMVASRWQGVLTKTKYYTAIGSITEAALTRLLDDITALHDIPELESKRLSELCRIMHALEGLFVEDPEKSSFIVAYVPSWLKFSYLSELLEASLADIKYLFEEGALVDFEIDELVRLVKALFADTSLRTDTINKLLTGHANAVHSPAF